MSESELTNVVGAHSPMLLWAAESGGDLANAMYYTF